MTLGSQLIDEFRRRRELGMYFDYAGYQTLRRVDSPAALRKFLAVRGMQLAPETDDVVQIADWLRTTSAADSNHVLLELCHFHPYGALIGLPLWAMAWVIKRLRRRRAESLP